MLQANNIVSGYGPVDILREVSFSVEDGAGVVIIGTNGSGKTTLLRTITGMIKCRTGEIKLDGHDITDVAIVRRVSLGLVHVPEGRMIFAPLSVLENLLLGCYDKYSELGKEGRQRLIENMWELFPILSERRNQAAGTLSGGEQQMLAIARGLMAQPKLLLLDEPSLGLAPMIVDDIYSTLKRLNEEGLAILVVEQDVHRALSFGSYGYVLQSGQILLEGPASQLLGDEKVEKLFFGRAGV